MFYANLIQIFTFLSGFAISGNILQKGLITSKNFTVNTNRKYMYQNNVKNRYNLFDIVFAFIDKLKIFVYVDHQTKKSKLSTRNFFFTSHFTQYFQSKIIEINVVLTAHVELFKLIETNKQKTQRIIAKKVFFLI